MWTRGEYTISTDRGRLDLDVIHGYLARSYWAAGRSREQVARSIAESLPFGLYHHQAQVGFARVITDHVTLSTRLGMPTASDRWGSLPRGTLG
jgi:hypothetical protein